MTINICSIRTGLWKKRRNTQKPQWAHSQMLEVQPSGGTHHAWGSEFKIPHNTKRGEKTQLFFSQISLCLSQVSLFSIHSKLTHHKATTLLVHRQLIESQVWGLRPVWSQELEIRSSGFSSATQPFQGQPRLHETPILKTNTQKASNKTTKIWLERWFSG